MKSVEIRSFFSLNTGKYGLEKTPYLDTFLAVERRWNDAILCIFDVIGLNPNIPHEESSSFLKKHLDLRTEKETSVDTLVKLAKIVLKNNIFNFNLKHLETKEVMQLVQHFPHHAPFYSYLILKKGCEVALHR